ncbi:hypothetical protein B0H10DRAFT_2197201 [Mycena sp. CBHHK59/15]|nr:hypothetical protein B0H10DRAFT_2198903 [Mycena sp. CBHHK59/15]KAJ6596073.1 hypothetical protein B0H10DRAFT_2197201 [Mycena sp. CBHHK59/15]
MIVSQMQRTAWAGISTRNQSQESVIGNVYRVPQICKGGMEAVAQEPRGQKPTVCAALGSQKWGWRGVHATLSGPSSENDCRRAQARQSACCSASSLAWTARAMGDPLEASSMSLIGHSVRLRRTLGLEGQSQLSPPHLFTAQRCQAVWPGIGLGRRNRQVPRLNQKAAHQRKCTGVELNVPGS